MKYIKEFFNFSNEIKVGDDMTCIKDVGFSGAYRQLPRLYDFESGKDYKVTSRNKWYVTITSDQSSYFDKDDSGKSTQTFSLRKGDGYFLYLFDYFKTKITS